MSESSIVSASSVGPPPARQRGSCVRPARTRFRGTTAAPQLGEPVRHRADFFERLRVAGGRTACQHLVHEQPHGGHVVPSGGGGGGAARPGGRREEGRGGGGG